MRELAFEKRAKPKDRTKTEEELALEEKEALEKAERKRLRRMRGEDEDTEDEDELRKGRKRQRGGDDLDDDFMDDDADFNGLGVGLDAGLGDEAGNGEDDSDEEEEGESGVEEDDDDEGEDDEGMVSDIPDSEAEDAGEEGDSEDLVRAKRRKTKKSARPGQKKELPYTFPCPSSHDEFLEIVEDIDEEDVPTVVKRIRTLYHPSLAQDNKFKLQVRSILCFTFRKFLSDILGSHRRTRGPYPLHHVPPFSAVYTAVIIDPSPLRPHKVLPYPIR